MHLPNISPALGEPVVFSAPPPLPGLQAMLPEGMYGDEPIPPAAYPLP